ncbi:zinc-dependent metalloprotease [Desertivirga arenae]|uniref:zinc-dependent metalloprotease n=1 Tax=Desertivirga arenae TaxID=2810309 RepID=UPI001A9565C6|nr:zinc-dependent metalloprotease [Pedobacter sp. SYSU D00823]
MRFLFLLMICAASLKAAAQITPAKKDSTTAAGPQGYEKLFAKATSTKKGLFTIKYSDNKYYFEIPDSLFRRPILTITRFTATPQGFGKYGGEMANEQTVYFEKGFGNKIFLRAMIYRQETPDSTQAIYQAVSNSQVNPIVAAFDVKAVNPVNQAKVIEVTDFFRKDNSVSSVHSELRTEKKLGALADDRSFIEKVSAFPINIEVRTVKTYSTSSPQTAAGALTGTVTLSLNTSFVLLPKVPMRKRYFDERVGYFSNKVLNFDDAGQGSQASYYIQRYRLEPKEKDIERYKIGQLVEPKKQIVYYIDPATPKKWRPYLIQGVNDWQKAFEQAGFKNAIVAKEWPASDTSMSLEDARFSVIRYYASETPNAYGPRISDPRSGEIMESHVGWYHDVMKLVHGWYMIQVGPLDKRARKMVLDDELMGQLIRFVSSHEIGHTLGLRHNMGASSQTPVELLRDKKWVEKNGHTVSIMDYARFNYVAQPEDNIGPKGIFPRIGAYDKWAVEWGYRYFPGMAETKERTLLKKMIVDTLARNPRLWFGGEGKDTDPRSQTEDLGDNAMKAGHYGILNLKRVARELPEWTYEEGNLYTNLEQMHKSLVRQYSRYLYHVMKNLGNHYVDARSYEQAGNVNRPIALATVKQVFAYLDAELYEAPLWMYPSNITSKIESDPYKSISEVQGQITTMLLSPGMVFNVTDSTALKTGYNPRAYFTDVMNLIWKVDKDPASAKFRRVNQRLYLEKLNQLVNPTEAMTSIYQRSDVRLYAIEHCNTLLTRLKSTSPQNELEELHYEYSIKQLNKIIEKYNKAD